MSEEVYDFLSNYGFTDEEIDSFENVNEKMFYTDTLEIEKNINILINKGLIKEEIMDIFRKNHFMITAKNNKLEAFDNIFYNVLGFNNDIIRQIIIKEPGTYSASPIELQKIIDFLKEYGWSLDKIKAFLIENPKVICLYLDEFKNSIKDA